MTHPTLDFAALVERHKGAVCAIAFAVLRDRALSEEVAQDAFLLAWQKLPAMHPTPSFPGWVCGIARNLARNAARRRKETVMTDEPISSTTPLDHVLDRESHQLADRALATLSPSERDAIVLFYRGESIADVASALGISEAAAKKRVTRGRDRLRAAASAVETTLRATRPGPAFTAACVAALAAGGTSTASPASVARAQPRPLTTLALGTAIALPITAVAIWAASEHGAAPVEARGVARSAPIASPPPPSSTALARRITGHDKASLAERIRAARTLRVRATASSSSTPTTHAGGEQVRVYDFAGGSLFEVLAVEPPREPGPLTKRDLRGAIRSVQPLLRECYADAAPRLPRRNGALELRLRIEGEPEVGSIVTSASLGGDAHLAGDRELAECVEQTLLSIEMPGLDVGGIVDVSYPLTIP